MFDVIGPISVLDLSTCLGFVTRLILFMQQHVVLVLNWLYIYCCIIYIEITGTLSASVCWYACICLVSCKIWPTDQPTNSVTHSMEQSPWEANTHSTSQETPHLLLNLYVGTAFTKSLPLDPVWGQINPVHIITPFFISISF